jgi:hypothetical protein
VFAQKKWLFSGFLKKTWLNRSNPAKNRRFEANFGHRYKKYRVEKNINQSVLRNQFGTIFAPRKSNSNFFQIFAESLTTRNESVVILRVLILVQ